MYSFLKKILIFIFLLGIFEISLRIRFTIRYTYIKIVIVYSLIVNIFDH